jgi:signal transduction histidine kinase
VYPGIRPGVTGFFQGISLGISTYRIEKYSAMSPKLFSILIRCAGPGPAQEQMFSKRRMNHIDTISVVSGVLQLAVACYALRLIRLFGTARVGWSAFSAFSLLVLLHALFSMESFRDRTEAWLKVDVVYGLVAMLLLVSLVHLDSLLKERSRSVALVKNQTAELTRTNDELKRATVELETEIAERNEMQKKMEKTHRELLSASRQAGMSEVATAVLHNVGNVLNSVNVSASLVADRLGQFKIDNIARVANIMREHAADIGIFMTHDPKGKQLPEYLAQLARHLSAEQHLLLEQIDFVKKKIDHIKEIVATQQNYGRVAGVTEKVRVTDLIEDVLRIHAGELEEQKIQLHREFEPDQPEIIVDKHKVMQILLNLLSNARHACVESGGNDRQVTVRVSRGGDRVRVALSDNGVGIPAPNLGKIFNHGFTTKKKGGHGFGLHSGALAAKEMGGTLQAQSEGPGTGATFTLELPFTPDRSKTPKA